MSSDTDAPRVLLVSPEYPPTPGGVGDYTALLARHLTHEGATVAVLTSGTGADTNENGVRVLRRVPRWGWGLRGYICDAIRDTSAKIVHIQYQTGMYGMHPAVNLLPLHLRHPHGLFPLVAREAHATKSRVFTTFHDLLPPYLFPKAGPLRDGVTRLIARTSDGVIATNGADMATLRRWGVRAALVPIGSNIPASTSQEPGEQTAVRERYKVPPDAALLTTFGLTNTSKGLDTLIDTLALLQSGGTPVFLLVVGAGAGANDATNRGTEQAVRAQIAARGMTASVAFTGALPAEAVAAAIAASDVCLLPYRDGASPRRGSLLAALTQGVPVVTTIPRPGVYDGLPPLTEKIAALVPPNDAPALAVAVRRILSDNVYAAHSRDGARAYAAQFAWGAIARATLAVYRGERQTTWAATETGT